jgi:hypothetical protein
MAASVCTCLHTRSYLAEYLALPARATGEAAALDVITATVAGVHVSL